MDSYYYYTLGGYNVKNNADAIIFHMAVCAEASQTCHNATKEIAYANFSCASSLRFGMEDI